MSKNIQFSLRIVNAEGIPVANKRVICKAELTGETFNHNTDNSGIVEYAFQSEKKSIDINIHIDNKNIRYEFHDKDGITLKLLPDGLDMFLEMVIDGK